MLPLSPPASNQRRPARRSHQPPYRGTTMWDQQGGRRWARQCCGRHSSGLRRDAGRAADSQISGAYDTASDRRKQLLSRCGLPRRCRQASRRSQGAIQSALLICQSTGKLEIVTHSWRSPCHCQAGIVVLPLPPASGWVPHTRPFHLLTCAGSWIKGASKAAGIPVYSIKTASISNLVR